MTRVQGPSLDQLDRLGDDYAGLVAHSLAQVATSAAAQAVDLHSPEELVQLRTLWGFAVVGTLLPSLGVAFEVGAAQVRVGLREAVGLTAAAFTDVAPTSDALSEQYLAQARNRLVGVGDELWSHAREGLLEGLQAGESVPELAARVRKAAPDLTEPRASVIARTEVLGAVNAGALEQVLASGATGSKQWIATDDDRTRHTHDLADNDTVGLREHFTVGGFPMQRPHDPAGPPQEVISCRCALAFDLDLPDIESRAEDEQGQAADLRVQKEPAASSQVSPRARDDRSFLARVFADGLAALVGWFKARTAAAMIPEQTFEGGTVTADASQPVEHFHYRMAEGVSTGLRTFATGAITWREPPFAFMWQKMVPESGGHGLAVQAGLITRAERSGEQVDFYGPLDLNSEDGLEYARRLVEGFARWGSVSPDENKVDVEVVWAEGLTEEEMVLGAEPEQYVFRSFNVAELTALSVPALADATIEPTPALLEELERRNALPEGVKVPRSDPEAVVAAAVLDDHRPPAEFFTRCTDPIPTVTTPDGRTFQPALGARNGRVWGYAAHWKDCHIGYPGVCTSPPQEDDFAHYMVGEVLCAGGERVPVGQITINTGHASTLQAARTAAEHYDHTGAAVADVVVGADDLGIWFSGALRPGADEAALRAAGSVSGDWRRINGSLRLVAVLAVNVAGFQQVRARVASGVQTALVAAGQVVREEVTEPDLSRVKKRIAAPILASRRTAAAARLGRG